MQKRFNFVYCSFFTALFIGALFTNIIYAQLSSLKDLKSVTQHVNEINKGVDSGDPWTVKNIITPDELEKELNSKNKPVVLQVGFGVLYNQGHIKGAIYSGPASREEGIKKLKSEVKKIPHSKEVVIYCGCCGWADCPNIHPAFTTLKKMGFDNLKLLFLPNNFTKDWVNKGLPVEK